MSAIRRHVIFGAIAGAVAVVAILAIVGIFIAFFAGTAGAIAGAAMGLVLSIVTWPLRMLRGDRGAVRVKPM